MRASAAGSPATNNRLSRAVSPPTMRTEPRDTPKVFATSATSAALAAPSTGGALTRAAKYESVPASNRSRPPRGVRRTLTEMPSAAARQALR